MPAPHQAPNGSPTFHNKLSTLCVILIAACLVCVVQHANSYALNPRLEIRPKETEVNVDMKNPKLVLSCLPDGDRPEAFTRVRWSGPNSTENWQELSQRHIVREESKDSNSWELQFRKPTPADEGIYYCRGEHQLAQKLETSIKVKFYTPIEIRDCNEKQSLVKGASSAKIHCSISADQPKLTVRKDDIDISEYSKRYIWDTDGIIINGEVNDQDAGLFFIRVKSLSTGHWENRYIQVDISTKPEIIPPPVEEFFSVEGEPAKLECNSTGIPKPLIYWFDPQMRNLSQDNSYVVDNVNGILIINKADRRRDHGKFECHASNGIGTARQTFTMNIDVKPAIVNFVNQTVDEGQEVTFECRSTGEPSPNFTIRKGGLNQSPYRPGDGFVRDMHTESERGGSSVYVHRLKIVANRDQDGYHYCNASNRAGSSESVNYLHVAQAPDLSKTTPEQYVRPGKQKIVTCSIEAYPEPTVTWTVNGLQLANVESSIKTSPNGRTHIITMMPPDSLSNFDRYVCQAKNRLGNSEKAILLRSMTRPSQVIAVPIETTPTTIKLNLSVVNDGGDRLRYFKYRIHGSTLDIHNPFRYNLRDHSVNETLIDASLQTVATYTFRNLMPNFRYTMIIRAINGVGEGDESEIPFETTKPTRPNKPFIIRSNPMTSTMISDYSNGYVLRWSPPDLDNGEPVSKYIMNFNKVEIDSLGLLHDVGYNHEFEQMSNRPLEVKVGPLETETTYRLRLRAVNNLGESDDDVIIFKTRPGGYVMPDFELSSLGWINDIPTSTFWTVWITCSVLLILVELVSYFYFQVGVTHTLRKWCCPAKANSLVSEKAN